jgi:hypothetical protein
MIPKNKKNIMKKNKFSILLFIVAIILICVSIASWIYRPIEVRTIDVEFSVGATAGINLDTDKLYLGRVSPGGSMSRAVDIENSYDYPVEIKIFVTKNIADYLLLDKEFIALPKNITKVPISLIIPEDMAYGNYTGKLRFEFFKI